MVGVDGSSLCADSPPKSICLVWGQRCLHSSSEPDELSQWNTVKIGMDTIIIITLRMWFVCCVYDSTQCSVRYCFLHITVWYLIRLTCCYCRHAKPLLEHRWSREIRNHNTVIWMDFKHFCNLFTGLLPDLENSGKSLNFFLQIFKALKVLEQWQGPWKSLNLIFTSAQEPSLCC